MADHLRDQREEGGTALIYPSCYGEHSLAVVISTYLYSIPCLPFWFSLSVSFSGMIFSSVFFWCKVSSGILVSEYLKTRCYSRNPVLTPVNISFTKDSWKIWVEICFFLGPWLILYLPFSIRCFENCIEAWEAEKNTEITCSTLCNLNLDQGKGFSYSELFKRIYINPRLLLIILVFFELVKV